MRHGLANVRLARRQQPADRDRALVRHVSVR
jgi:hypothetical protein